MSGKNLSTSIFVFSLLLFMYWSCSIWWSVGKWGSLGVSPATLLLHFDIRQRPWLCGLVISKMTSFKKRRQLFLLSFCIVFLSLFFRALWLCWWCTLPVALYWRLALLVPASSCAASSDHLRRAYLLGLAFRQYSSRQLFMVLYISSSIILGVVTSLLVISWEYFS